MKTQRRTADEQYQLIMECRSSGLSEYQWCTEHNMVLCQDLVQVKMRNFSPF